MHDELTPPELTGVAIIGMSGRFPGADTIDEFWRNLRAGVESITRFSDEELARAGVAVADREDPRYVKAGSVLSDVSRFDAAFFGFSPREAESMDPQHRLLLEGAWGALEDAGYANDTERGRVGAYLGASASSYLHNNLLMNPEFLGRVGDLQIEIGNDKDFAPTRISYKLNLRGPSVCVNTACSTSLVAVHIGCQALLDEECDMALAGGVTIQVPQGRGYWYQEHGISSPDGHCRPFDALAGGTVFGNGLGVVLLRRVEDALAAGDHIYAVIRGSAINNDGSQKVGYTAPSIDGQAEVISEAMAVADIAPETITYVEAHGTATSMGDPIEVTALTQAYRAGTDECGYCAIGSVKGNFGHLNRAAGVVGLIKTALAVEAGELPPTLHFDRPNPQINFETSPFYVNEALQPWNSGGAPRRAGVSSFGIGGTNAHVVLEQAPAPEAREPAARVGQILVVSARTETALSGAANNLARHLERTPDIDLRDAAHTLQTGRRAFAHRRFVVCHSLDEAVSALDRPASRSPAGGTPEGANRPVAFMFSGQGAQYVGMARGLYLTEPSFRDTVDRCATSLKTHLGTDIRDIIYPSPQATGDGKRSGAGDAAQALRQTANTQPALFVIEYALAQLWMSWGVLPRALIGHSIGEYVAACLAGVFSLEDGLALVAARGRMMQALPGGSLLAVFSGEDDLLPLLGPEVALAAVNGPRSCTVAGPDPAIDALASHLTGHGIDYRRVHTSHAFHSPMMDPILDSFTAEVAAVDLKPPQIPFPSNVTGDWISDEQATDPHYWARHLRQTVRFSQGLTALLEDADTALLEVGPGATLCSLASRHPDAGGRTVLSTLGPAVERTPDIDHVLATLGQLWVAGVRLDWHAFQANESVRRVSLPTYPFEGASHWVAPATASTDTPGSTARALLACLLGSDTDVPTGDEANARSRIQDLLPYGALSDEELALAPKVLAALSTGLKLQSIDTREWLYEPRWLAQALATPLAPAATDTGPPASCLIVADSGGVGERLAALLEANGSSCILAFQGTGFAQTAPDRFSVSGSCPADWKQLIESTAHPDAVVHLWSLDARDDSSSDQDRLETTLRLGCRSALGLVQALAGMDSARPTRLYLVTCGAQTLGMHHDAAGAFQSPLWGIAKVVVLEHRDIGCRSLDLDPADDGPEQARLLHDEVCAHSLESQVVFRASERHVARLSRTPAEAARPDESPHLDFRQDGTYLVTGGLGGLGLLVAGWMARSGARHLALLGRHEPGKRARDEIAALERAGVMVMVVQADVTAAMELADALADIEKKMPPVAGVVHAAGVLDDGTLARLSWDRFAHVLGPKVRGAWNLHEATRGRSLDFFVMFSSAASLLGFPGQANHVAANTFLDVLAFHRHCAGLPAQSINWGIWSAVGSAVGKAVSGIGTIDPTTGLRLLASTMAGCAVQQGVTPVHWPTFRSLYQGREEPAFLAEVLESPGDPSAVHAEADIAVDLAGALAAAGPAKQFATLTEYLRGAVAETLGMDAQEIAADVPLSQFGLDSLMSIQLSDRLNVLLGVDVPMVRFIEGNIAEVAMNVEAQLQAGSGPPSDDDIVEGEL